MHRRGEPLEGSKIILPPEKFEILILRDAISSFLRAQLKFDNSIVIFILIYMASRTSIPFYFTFHEFLKFSGVSVFITYTLICVLE